MDNTEANQEPQRGREASELSGLVILPQHPCWTGDDYDHNWEFQDDSFDHEFGCERVWYFICSECGATRDMEQDDYYDEWDFNEAG